MQRRSSTSQRRSSSFRWLWWLAGLIIVSGLMLVLLAPTLVTNYIRTYLRQDDFRQKAEEMTVAKLGGKARIAQINWNDDTASIADLSLETAGGWNVDAGGIRASLDFGAIRQGAWSIQNAGADDLTLRRVDRMPEQTSAAEPSAPKGSMDADSIPSFLRRYIPAETQISGFDIHQFVFEQGAWKIADTQLRLGGWKSGEISVSAKMSGGSLQTPIAAPEQKKPLKFELAHATLRLGDSQLQLSDAALRWKQGSEVTLRGGVKFETGEWQTFAHFKAVPLDEFLDPTWKQRLSGKIEGDLEMSGSHGSPPEWKTEVALKGGALTGLPVLDKLVTYTNTHRFKRLVLDICSATIRAQGDALVIEKIVVQSNGLLRIEGALAIRGREVSGDLMLGVTPETVRGIPGAERRVFVETNPAGPPGLQWARVHVAGTLDAPKEDLSSRLVGAVGMSLLFDTPQEVGLGAEKLLKPVVGDEAAKVPGKVIDGASGVIESGVKTGAGMINKVLPIFPGK
ncbi:hypothetical protein [Prosthecobacter sp.]|uniref:hypothetical protein n=1 Tax=Prosthecobacter sp. TaxID=1965333 RepID=UPI001D5B4BB3|nr:hypothetical protein [Prosthecobacter sp.]MCB1278068.1 hypothetical protein [Prosthecobacter sp.]